MESDQKMEHAETHDLRENIGWFVAMAIGLIILGLLSITVPLVSTFAMEYLIGILFAVGGIILFIHALRWKVSDRLYLNLLLGVLYFVFGIFLLAYPIAGVMTLTLMLSIFSLVVGGLKVTNAILMRPASKWAWLLASGIVSVLLGFVIWTSMPLTAFWAIGLLVGIDLLVSGFAMLILLFELRSVLGSGQIFCIGGECFTA